MRLMPSDVPNQQQIVRRIGFFGKHYSLYADCLMDDDGRVPDQVINDLILRYLTVPLPIELLSEDAWCSFRELHGAGPLSVKILSKVFSFEVYYIRIV